MTKMAAMTTMITAAMAKLPKLVLAEFSVACTSPIGSETAPRLVLTVAVLLSMLVTLPSMIPRLVLMVAVSFWMLTILASMLLKAVVIVPTLVFMVAVSP